VPSVGSFEDYLDVHHDRFVDELKEFLRIPSVSTDPARKGEVDRCACFTAEALRRAGLSRVEVCPTGGHPAVVASWEGAPGAPTVLLYGHYDVQPEEPVERWSSPPFEPVVREGRIYARGSADDKGQVHLHIKAMEALLSTRKKLPVNLKIVIEGEEEIGSPHLAPFIRKNKDRLKADLVLISDTTLFGPGIPSITYGLRGLSYFEIEVTGPNRDLHSGHFGGAVDNPAETLARLLSRLKDDQGRVTVPGFYDDVVPLTGSEREGLARLPHDDGKYRKDLEVGALKGEAGYTTLERMWARPTLEINGLRSGWGGAGAKTVLPSKAIAKVSMRLVPDQRPDKIAELFSRHVRSPAPAGCRVEVRELHGARPYMVSPDHPALQAGARAFRRAYGKEPVFIREGGSIPITADFQDILGVPSVLLGFGLPDENAHGPDENLDLENYRMGMRTAAYFYEEVAGSMRGISTGR
jgi:acetylornithine deacetylase/succinyl-diaminopimelate desuccinylase-like protein